MAQGAATDPMYGLEVMAGADAAFEAFVNGAPVGAKPAGRIGVQSLAVHAEIVPGPNVAEVMAGTAEVGPRSLTPRLIGAVPDSLYVVLKLQRDHIRVQDNQYETTVEELDEAVWRPLDDPNPAQAPHRLFIRFDAPADTPPPAWLAARPVTAEAAREPVLAQLERLRALLLARDVDGFTAAMVRRYADIARAYPLGGQADARRVQDAQSVSDIVNSPDFDMEPLDRAGVECRVYAGGRMVGCRDRHGRALLRAKAGPEGPFVEFRPLFSLLGQNFEVVR